MVYGGISSRRLRTRIREQQPRRLLGLRGQVAAVSGLRRRTLAGSNVAGSQVSKARRLRARHVSLSLPRVSLSLPHGLVRAWGHGWSRMSPRRLSCVRRVSGRRSSCVCPRRRAGLIARAVLGPPHAYLLELALDLLLALHERGALALALARPLLRCRQLRLALALLPLYLTQRLPVLLPLSLPLHIACNA
jgi:hypothetical protein